MRARGRGGSRDAARRELRGSGAGKAREKREARERRLAERRRRARLRSLVWLGLLAAVLVACGFLYNAPIFPVKNVEVTGTSRLDAEAVRTLARVPEDATLLRFPADEVAERVEADPWVETASVTRDFPDTMQIRVEEREPAALVDMLDEYLIVDAEGYIIEARSLEETTALVVIRDLEGMDPTPGRRSTSEGLHNALAVLADLSDELRAMTRAVSVATIDETALLTTDGVEIFVGLAEDVAKKDVIAREILAEQSGRVVFIDVRSVERPIWRGLEE